jgi:hypothetical protein
VVHILESPRINHVSRGFLGPKRQRRRKFKASGKPIGIRFFQLFFRGNCAKPVGAIKKIASEGLIN